MASPLRTGLGARVASARGASRMTQLELANAAGVSLSMLRKIEQGARNPSDSALASIADALGIDINRLLGIGGMTDSRITAELPAMRAAIDAYDIPADGPVRTLPELRQAVGTAVDRRLASQYLVLAQTLPDLLTELARAVCILPEPGRSEAAGLLASAYRAADAVAYKHGHFDLSGRLVELVRWASARADDEVQTAAAAYVRTELFFVSGNLALGLRALERAIDAAPAPLSLPVRAARVALHMRASVVAARMRDADAARAHMREAKELVASVPEGIYCGTSVGPSSLRVHQTSAAIELGDSASVLELASEWQPGDDLPAERRSHFYIDLAQAQLWRGQREACFESLQLARRIAPQHVREHPQVRDTLATLVRLQRSSTETLLGYAEWAHAI
ncbi:helix-turn-helix domain-containing protein [Embleya sp. NPDC020630]|uniref:helix-turn-helix domain-containing protein n=1 Tax=Embleya sp. NPDC020630 TaxID=3363979 RepID=UPI0037919DC6